MRTVDMHEAETHLSQLVERAAEGEAFIIAKAGKPLVKVVPLEKTSRLSRLNFLKGQIQVPDDFDTMCQEEIEEMFGIEE